MLFLPGKDPPQRGPADAEPAGGQGLVPVVFRQGMFYNLPRDLLQRHITGEKTADFIRLPVIEFPFPGEKLRRGRPGDHVAPHGIVAKLVECRHPGIESQLRQFRVFFREHFRDDCLFLLDEPENSLSPKYQTEVANLILEYVRFFGCQFVISTHSPFFLSMKGALIYDLDSVPVVTKAWWELGNMKAYYRLFSENREKFEK